MYNKSSVETNGKPDREKSRSSLSLLWEEISGAPIDLQGYVESCWNNLKIVDIDLDGAKPLELNSILDKPHLQDSGTSSLNDEDTCSVPDSHGISKPTAMSVKTFVEQFSQGINSNTETGKWKLVVNELLDTESAYLGSLKEVDDGYLEKFHGPQNDSNGDINVIFSNWKLLRQFHSQFHTQLRLTSYCGFSGLKKLANCFLNDVSKFEELYSDYCMNYSKSIKHLSNIEHRDSEVWHHLLQCQHELGHALPLSTFLLKPVQRILKYQLLLQELIHSCESVATKESKDVMQSLLKALEEMINVASRINDRQTEQEELSRQIRLRNELYAEIISSHPLFPDLGYPFHDGELKVPGSRNARVALLCQHALVLAKRLGNGRWDIKQVIKCEKMMLFEYIPKQPLGFYMVDLSNPKSKSTVLALTKEDKDIWCTKIKELIIGSYDAGLISDRAKRILLENKQNALAMNEPSHDHVTESHQMKLNPDEEELLDLETTLRRMLDPALENNRTFTTNKNLSIKRRNSVGVDRADLKTNYRDPSIYQKANRRFVEVDTDLDCRSITVDINEEVLREAGGSGAGVVSMQIQTYERYIEVARTKIRLTPEDIEEIFMPLRQLSLTKDSNGSNTESPAPLADIELVAFCSDQESTASDRPNSANRHRKTASMDRNFGLSINGKASSYSNTLNLDPIISDDTQRKKPLFSSVRGTKATRSNTEWCGTVESEIRPGIVKSISRLFRASSKFGKRDKTRPPGPEHSMSTDNATQPPSVSKTKAHLNKSNSTDHIVQTPFLLPKSHFGKKSRAPPPPANLAQLSRLVKEELEDSDLLNPTKPPRKSLYPRLEMFNRTKSSSTEGLRCHDTLCNGDLAPPSSGVVSESPSPFKVKDLVSLFQSDQ